MLIIVLHKAVE